MKKILFAAMAAVILCSMFVSIKMANTTDVLNTMDMNPTEKTVNPTSTDLTFLYEVDINTSVSVSAWQAKLMWNPQHLRALSVVWGTFMDAGEWDYSYTISSAAEYIIMSQFYTEEVTSTGQGILAYVNFTFVLPGQTYVNFVESRVWDNDLVPTDLLGVNGRVKSEMPHPSFAWSTADGRNPLPTHTVYDGGDSLVNSDVVTFNASSSYDVSLMTWNAGLGDYQMTPTVWNGLGKLEWLYGDGGYDYVSVAGGNMSWTVTHTYAKYNQTGWLVTLIAWDTNATPCKWSSQWRYGGAAPGDTVPMWRDVAIVDIWPSLPPYQNIDAYGDDWWSYWFFDSSDYYIPSTWDPYWDYNLTQSYCDQYWGYMLPCPDTRLPPTPAPYVVGDLVQPGDSDIGRPLSWFNETEMFYDKDGSGFYDSVLESIVYDADGDGVYNATNGDVVLYGPAILEGKALSAFYAEMYDDADASGCYTAGEYVYWDNDAFEEVSADPIPTVRQGWEDYGSSGLYVLVTGNNLGSVSEKVQINLYAVGIAVKNAGVGPAYTSVQVTDFEMIGTWTKTMAAGTGTGWGCYTIWVPPKNATYIIFATIESYNKKTGNSAAIGDQDYSNNQFVLSSPVTNLGTWNATSLSMVPAGAMNVKYLCDIGKGGDGSIKADDLNLLLSQFGSKGPAGSTKIPISKP